jgi:nucleoside-diphosphate-sugar epimerase
LRILLSGVSGFLGSNLANRLVSDGYDVVGIKRRGSVLSRLLENTQSQMVFCDIEDGLDNIFSRYSIDIIVHAATEYGRNQLPNAAVLRANLTLPLDLLDFATNKGCKGFVNSDTFFSKNNGIYEYLSAYTTSKKLFNQVSQKYIELTNMPFANMTIEHMYGPNDGLEKFVPNILSQLALDAQEIEMTMGEQMRDFIYIDDVIDAYLLVVESFKRKLLKGYNGFEVGTGQATSVKDFVLKAHELIDSKSSILFGALEYRNNELKYSRANNEALRSMGWIPKLSIEDGIKRIVGIK